MAITVRGLTPLLEVFELVSGGDLGWCMLKLGEATLMLNTAYDGDERPPAPDSTRVRGHADTSLYFSSPDPGQVYAHLSEKGWSVTEPIITSYGMKQVSTRDPDGFQLF